MGHYKVFHCDACKLEFPEHMLTKTGAQEVCGDCLESTVCIVVRENHVNKNRTLVAGLLQTILKESNIKSIIVQAQNLEHALGVFDSFALSIAIGFVPPALNEMPSTNALAKVLNGIVHNLQQAVTTDIAVYKSVDRS